MLYRALKNLHNGKRGVIWEGCVFSVGELNTTAIPILEEKKAIARVNTPPLGVLASWRRRAGKLNAAGIITVEDFIEASTEQLCALLKLQEADVEAHKNAFLRMLSLPKPEG